MKKHLISLLVFLLFMIGHIETGAWGQTDPARIALAKKEGEVIWYSNLAVDRGDAIARGFMKAHPYVKVKYFRANAPQLANRVMTEAQAGKSQMDVLLISFFFLDQIIEAGILEPYCSSERAAFPPEFKDKDCLWTLINANTHVIAYNTQLVNRNEAPKNYSDLLNPRWREKMVIDDEGYRWFTYTIDKMGETKGLTFMKRLAAQKLNFRHGDTLISQLLAAGEFSVCIVCYGYRVELMKSKGAPVDWNVDEPVTVSGSTVSLARRAPHRNAAQLLIDYILSKEGQTVLASFFTVPARKDVPPLAPRLIQGLKLHPIRVELSKKLSSRRDQFFQIFKH
ncbi:MAG: extracellular solute-binding protein [Deltaproteobacteria bacterium]|nr:extracellular solute-binding protein [Deltaproteobacteria bacterium]